MQGDENTDSGCGGSATLVSGQSGANNSSETRTQQSDGNRESVTGTPGSGNNESEPATGGSGNNESESATGGSGNNESESATGGSENSESEPATGGLKNNESEPTLGGSEINESGLAIGGSENNESGPAIGGSENNESGPAIGGSENNESGPAIGGSENNESGPAIGGSESNESGPAIGGSESNESGLAIGGSENNELGPLIWGLENNELGPAIWGSGSNELGLAIGGSKNNESGPAIGGSESNESGPAIGGSESNESGLAVGGSEYNESEPAIGGSENNELGPLIWGLENNELGPAIWGSGSNELGLAIGGSKNNESGPAIGGWENSESGPAIWGSGSNESGLAIGGSENNESGPAIGGSENSESEAGCGGVATAEKSHTLSNDDVKRYSRQIILPDFGPKGQEKLRDSSLLIVGAGGLGCQVALYCAAAGIGRIGIVDGDIVTIENLHRQIAYNEDSVGKLKVMSMEKSLAELNSKILIDTYARSLSANDAYEIISKYDVVADCTDNLGSRYLINDVCVKMTKPLVSASALGWEGQLSVYNLVPDNACYCCVFPHRSSKQGGINCAGSGIMGPVVGVIGSMQANEIIKIIVNGKSSFSGVLFTFDALHAVTKHVKLRGRRTNCPSCGPDWLTSGLYEYHTLSRELQDVYQEGIDLEILGPNERIEPDAYARLRRVFLKIGKMLLLDVRPQHEFNIGRLPEAVNMPMRTLTQANALQVACALGVEIEELKRKTVYVICYRGNDSQLAVLHLRRMFDDPMVCFKDIAGGYRKWSQIVDPSFPFY